MKKLFSFLLALTLFVGLMATTSTANANAKVLPVSDDTAVSDIKSQRIALQSVKAGDHHGIVARSASCFFYDLLVGQVEELGIFQLARYEQFNCVTASVDKEEQRIAVLASGA